MFHSAAENQLWTIEHIYRRHGHIPQPAARSQCAALNTTKEITVSLIKSIARLAGVITLSFAGFISAGPDTDTDANGVILAGHDAVAYFTEGKPVEGSPKYTAVYNDAIYRFS